MRLLWVAAFSFLATTSAASGAEAVPPAAASRSAELHIDRWAKASREVDAVDFDQYRDRYGEAYPNTVLRYAAAFFGPVDARGLKEAFRWTTVSETDSEVILRATPRKLDRLATLAGSDPSSAASSSPATVPTAIRGDYADDALAFDIILDQRFVEPRVVRWLQEDPAAPREGVERLDNSDLMALGGTVDCGGTLLSRPANDVETASALLVEGDEAAANNPALLEVLSRWEQASSDLRSVELKFKRFDYDNIFELETRGVGRFVFVAPNRGVYDLKGASVIERAEGRTDVRGGKFAVSSAKPQTIWWTGETVTIIDVQQKTFDELRIPKRARGEVLGVGSWDVIWQVLAGPQKAIPGIVDLRGEQLLNRFQWTLLVRDDSQIKLEGRPKQAADRRHLSRLDVILDAKSFLTTATRLVDPSASHETVHVFEYVTTNAAELENDAGWKPDLKGLAPVGPPPMAPPADELPVTPPPQE